MGVGLEIRIPISPTPSYVNRVRLIAASVREFYPDAEVTVSCYPPIDELPGMPLNLLPSTWRFSTPAEFDLWRGTQNEYVATITDRWKPPFHASHVLMLDGDVLCCDRFDELFELNALCGIQAHVPPFSNLDWEGLYKHFHTERRTSLYAYSGYNVMYHGTADKAGPPYMNTGVVFGPAFLFERIYETYMDVLHGLRRIMNSYFFEQIALTIAASKADVPLHILPMRYNFPNQHEFDLAYPDELAAAKFLHFLRTDVVNREADFVDEGAIHALAERTDLTGSNEVLRRRLEALLT